MPKEIVWRSTLSLPCLRALNKGFRLYPQVVLLFLLPSELQFCRFEFHPFPFTLLLSDLCPFGSVVLSIHWFGWHGFKLFGVHAPYSFPFQHFLCQ